VSYGGAYTNVGKQFLDVAAKYDTERGQTDDVNNLFSCNAYGVSCGCYSSAQKLTNVDSEMAKVDCFYSLQKLSFL
jgi:hypothetical protein